MVHSKKSGFHGPQTAPAPLETSILGHTHFGIRPKHNPSVRRSMPLDPPPGQEAVGSLPGTPPGRGVQIAPSEPRHEFTLSNTKLHDATALEAKQAAAGLSAAGAGNGWWCNPGGAGGAAG